MLLFKNKLRLLFFVFVAFSWAEENEHTGTLGSKKLSKLLKDELQFNSQSHDELSPDSQDSSKTVHREMGTVTFGPWEKYNAIWVYQGTKGNPRGDLDLFAVMAGKAKTFSAANQICSKMVPLGEWRLVNIIHVMAFFNELLPGHAMYKKPEFKGRFFWSTSMSEKSDKKNREDFFAVNEGGGEKLQVLAYSKFIQWITASQTRAKSTEEKNYYKDLLKNMKEGIPVLCIRGKEPQAR